MSKFQIHKATRHHAKLRMALVGPAGAGKTYSALAIGTALVPNGRVVVIDTECGSAELYGNRFDFDTLPLTSHSPLNYVEAIQYCEDQKYDVIVVDSLSHAWMGKDGALDQVDKVADRGGSKFDAWRTVTPKHNALVEKMLNCKAHLITTIRAKTSYVVEKNEKTGKTEIRKLGLEAIQRDGLEYEFTLVGDIDLSNTLKVSKTRLDGVMVPGDIFEKPGANLAGKIYSWLMDGAPVTPIVSVVPPVAEVTPVPNVVAAPVEPTVEPVVEDVRSQIEQSIDATFADYLDKLGKATTLDELDRVAGGAGKPAKTDADRRKLAAEVYRATKEVIVSKQAVAS